MRTTKTNSDQRGIAAILVTMIMLLVISLIVLTYSKIIRREQRQTLDRQLNTQAFYAAESGINAAIDALQKGTLSPLDENDNCTDTALALTLDAASGVKVTCLIVTRQGVPNIIKDVDDNSTVFPLNTTADISSVTISWRKTGVASNPLTGCGATTTDLPQFTSWTCSMALLRVDLVPIRSNSTRADLVSKAYTAFMYPVSSGGGPTTAIATTLANQGAMVPVQCSGAPSVTCSIQITGMNGGSLNSSSWGLRVRSIYGNSTVTVSATSTAGPGPALLSGAQAIVDSTGKANDVLRRIQVRVPLDSATLQVPDYGLQARDGLCKRLSVNKTAPYGTTVDTTGITDPNGACAF